MKNKSFLGARVSQIILCLFCLSPRRKSAAISTSKAKIDSDSLFNLKGAWKNQKGEMSQLKSFSGKPILISMVYTSCAYSCPMTITEIQKIEKKLLSEKKFTNYQIVLASFDTEKDTPAQLKAYMKKRTLDEALWTFLSADKDSTVRELALVLGINYKRLADGDFSHSNILTLLSSEGKILFQVNGFASEADSKALTELLLKTVP